MSANNTEQEKKGEDVNVVMARLSNNYTSVLEELSSKLSVACALSSDALSLRKQIAGLTDAVANKNIELLQEELNKTRTKVNEETRRDTSDEFKQGDDRRSSLSKVTFKN